MVVDFLKDFHVNVRLIYGKIIIYFQLFQIVKSKSEGVSVFSEVFVGPAVIDGIRIRDARFIIPEIRDRHILHSRGDLLFPFLFGFFQERVVFRPPLSVEIRDDVKFIGKIIFITLVVELFFHLALNRRKGAPDVVVGIYERNRSVYIIPPTVSSGIGTIYSNVSSDIGTVYSKPRLEVVGKVFIPRLGENRLNFHPRQKSVTALCVKIVDSGIVVVNRLHIVAEPLIGKEKIAVGIYPDAHIPDV